MLRYQCYLAVAALLVSGSGCLNSKPPAPFELTADEQATLDKVLQAREANAAELNSFSCRITRWQYDPVFGERDKPKYIDQGELKFIAPNRGEFLIRGERAERCAFDGRTLWVYCYDQQEILRLDLEKTAIVSFGWFPLVFSTDADQLNKRYSMRIITPDDATGQIWLEAVPRRGEDACFFERAELIIDSKNLMVRAVQVYDPGGKCYVAYALHNIVRNDPALLGDGVLRTCFEIA